MGEDILLELMRQSDMTVFEDVCRRVGRAWSLTSHGFNEQVLDRVMAGEYQWLKILLENHLTQVEYGRGPSSSRSNGTWLNLLVAMAPERGWASIVDAVDHIPALAAGAFGKELSKTWQEPRCIPEAAVQMLRRVEEKETQRRAWLALMDPLLPASCPTHWQRWDTPLTHCIAKTVSAMEEGGLTTAVAACRKMVEQVGQLLELGADPAAAHQGDPALLLLSWVELAARSYSGHCLLHDQMLGDITSVFEKMAHKMDVSLPIGSSDASLAPETVAMVFADCLAPHCAALAIAHGCADQARDRHGNTWKMRAMIACCLDVNSLNDEDFCSRNHQGESLMHLFLRPRAGHSRWESLGETDTLALLGMLARSGISMDEPDILGNTPRSYALLYPGQAPHQFVVQLDASLLTLASPQSPRPHSARRI
jgi:hypothetical protein